METVELEGEYALVGPATLTPEPEQETNYWDPPSWTWVLPDPSRSSECSQVRSGQW